MDTKSNVTLTKLMQTLGDVDAARVPDYDLIRREAIDAGLDLSLSEVRDHFADLRVFLASTAVCANCKGYEACESTVPGYEPTMRKVIERILFSWRKCDKRLAMERQEEMKLFLGRAEIPAAYIGKTFRNFDAAGDVSGRLVPEAAALAKHRRTRGVAIAGPTGCGKSHLAVAILINWLADGDTGAYISMPDIIDKMRWDTSQIEGILKTIETVGLLVLDDIGTERKTEYAIETMYRVINARTMSGLPMVVTSNLSPEDLATRIGGVEGERIVSRISGACDWFQLNGNDRRREGEAEIR
jgi:DNA replication protein DnaC